MLILSLNNSNLLPVVSALLRRLALLDVQLPGRGLVPERGGKLQLRPRQPQDLRQPVPRARPTLLQERDEHDR